MNTHHHRLLLRLGSAALATALATSAAGGAPQGGEKLHFTYHWHLEQPIYWPDQQVGGEDRTERAWQSILRTDAGAPHPANDLRAIFSKPDRVAAYQWRLRDAIDAIRWTAEAGAQVSYSGCLVENVQSLVAAGQLGYVPTWYQSLREARGWTTVGAAKPRCDIVQFPFHHALAPLLAESTLRMQLRLYRQMYAEAWGASPPPSRGLFPPEMAFSMRMIPVLAQEGIDWVFVSGEKLSRACAGFPAPLGSGGTNTDPPNPADQQNPPQAHWFAPGISLGCTPHEAYPFAFTPHRARYVDPATGEAFEVIVVPCSQSLGWQDGYAPLGLSGFDQLQVHNDPQRPMLVVLAHDGDNAWGGGYDYYMNAVPQLVSQAQGAGYVATTVEEYLADHPVPPDDRVHVEDGSWVNPDGDFGSPQMLNWNWPLLDANGQVDLAGGWHVDARNWAVITAAQNAVDTAEQVWTDGGGVLSLARVLHPSAATHPVERAWHFFLAAFNSGFMYYGTALDLEVKPTVACNEALEHALPVIGDGSEDRTPPAIWLPQRHPWNPGAVNFGPEYGYQSWNDDGDFEVWTFVHDVSGLQSVVLRVREDADGLDPLDDDANELYAGGSGVGAWQDLPMSARAFPAADPYGDPSIDFFEMPLAIADQYRAEIVGKRSVLLDYYVEAVDTRGNVSRSPIQHVWVGDGSGAGGGGERVETVPAPPQAGQAAEVRYDPLGGPLAGAGAVFLHYGWNGWQTVAPVDPAMSWDGALGRWVATVLVPSDATQFDLVFHDGAGTWDNHQGQDWHFPVAGGSAPPWTMDGALDAGAVLVGRAAGLHLWAGYKRGELYLACEPAPAGRDRFIVLAGRPGPMRPAMWAKAGLVAGWDAFLGQEGDNGWHGWFDAGGAARSASGAVLEGVLPLAGETAVWDRTLRLGVLTYGTADGAALSPGEQLGPSLDGDGDGDVEAPELLRIDLSRLAH